MCFNPNYLEDNNSQIRIPTVINLKNNQTYIMWKCVCNMRLKISIQLAVSNYAYSTTHIFYFRWTIQCHFFHPDAHHFTKCVFYFYKITARSECLTHVLNFWWLIKLEVTRKSGTKLQGLLLLFTMVTSTCTKWTRSFFLILNKEESTICHDMMWCSSQKEILCLKLNKE